MGVNDRVGCLLTSNKGGSGIENMDSLIEAQASEAATQMAIELGKSEGEIKSDLVSIYPNPASTFVKIENKGEEEGEWTLLNALGQVMMKKKVKKGVEQIELEKLADGVYNYMLKFGKEIYSGKLTILQ